MILMGFDMETTGLDFQNDRPIEVGAILYSTGQKRTMESTGFLVKTDVAISSFITGLTGLTQAAVNKFGYDSFDALDIVIDMMKEAEAIVGQNVIRFDKHMLGAWASRHGRTVPEKLWIDTRTDLPGVESKGLTYMAADHGFLNLFPHGALTDVQTCLKIVSMYDIDAVVARAKEPIVILKAHTGFKDSGLPDNALAKARKFGWNPTYRLWYKVVKQSDVAAETSHGEFDVSFVTDIPVEKLWYS
jgi:DNA polymerase-3 subunit epsilon